ncbi:hypothetical protein ACFL4K_02105 [Candidatus Neomarinimicrobiota bacterium]
MTRMVTSESTKSIIYKQHLELEKYGAVKDAVQAYLACVSFADTMLRRTLDFDPVIMKFIGDAQANAMLTEEYRKNFEVPDVV